MYSYFMIIGKLELIEADIIGVNTGKECLEVNVKTSKYPELKVNDMIAVKGTIKAKGLCADKVYVIIPYIQEMKESYPAEEIPHRRCRQACLKQIPSLLEVHFLPE